MALRDLAQDYMLWKEEMKEQQLENRRLQIKEDARNSKDTEEITRSVRIIQGKQEMDHKLRDSWRVILLRLAREFTDSEDLDQAEEYFRLNKLTKIMNSDGNLNRLPSVRTTRQIS